MNISEQVEQGASAAPSASVRQEPARPQGPAAAGNDQAQPGRRSLAWQGIDTPIGPLLLVATHQGLVEVVFHATTARAARALEQAARRLGTAVPAAPEPDHRWVAEAVHQLNAYFDDGLQDFTLPLDWSLISGFNRRVLRELAAHVPYGTVVGYQDLAVRVGEPGAARAVGVAMASNPLPIVVPCHRVVESDGGIGGFGGGLETKRTLLALEGVLPQPLF